MGLRGDRFKVATCAVSTAIWIATCGRPDVADVKKLQRVPSPLGNRERYRTRIAKDREVGGLDAKKSRIRRGERVSTPLLYELIVCQDLDAC